MKNIFVVDDEVNICLMIKRFLEIEGFRVSCYENAESAYEEAFVHGNCPDMLIIDIMLPGMSGLELCDQIRQRSSVPIIIVSAKDEPLDRIEGINSGGDDYLVKPFLPLELVTRVKALFRRRDVYANIKKQEDSLQVVGDLKINAKSHTILICDEPFKVTPNEYDFISLMVGRYPQAVSKEEITSVLWNISKEYIQSNDINTRNVDTVVKRLRKKLRECKSQVQIETVWGYGYRIVIEGKSET